jgi:hypothetical protein
MENNDPLSIEDYDEFHKWWTKTYESDAGFKASSHQVQTVSFTMELAKFVERKKKELGLV